MRVHGAGCDPLPGDGPGRHRAGPGARPLPTVQDELLADYAALAEFQRGIQSGADMERALALKAAAIEEIERTVSRYARGRG